MDRMIVLVALAFAAPLAFISSAADACMAHYRSTDSLVLSSPLILIGEIESVRNDTSYDANTHSRLFADPSKDPGPRIATVRILRVLKGQCASRTIEVKSGPIESCAPCNEYMTFTKGDHRIFMLPAQPRKEPVCMRHWGSVLAVGDTELVQASLDRAAGVKNAFLMRMKKDSPRTYRQAWALCERMEELLPGNPDSTEKRRLEDNGDDLVPRDADPNLVKIIAGELEKLRIDAIHGAIAMAWQDPSGTWTRDPSWSKAFGALLDERKTEVLQYMQAFARRTLTDAGVESPHIDKYLSDANRPVFHEISFPMYFAYDYADARVDPEDLTTEFILRCQLYDRGEMCRTYGMSRRAVLSQLDANRVKDLVGQLAGNSNSQVGGTGYSVIRSSLTDAFVTTVLERMEVGDTWAWNSLANWDDASSLEKRLRALVEAGCSFGDRRDARLWRMLAVGYCFEDVTIIAAMERLGKCEHEKPDAEAEQPIKEALRAYLELAMAMRQIENAGPSKRNAAEYKAWFAAHPKLGLPGKSTTQPQTQPSAD